MLEILQDFESAFSGTARLSPIVLVGPGLVGVITGLFIWLGGLGFKKYVVAVAGAITGGICGFLAVGQNIISAAVTAALAVVLAILFERIFISILSGALAVIFAFIVLAGPNIENSQQETAINLNEIPAQGTALGMRESVEKVKAYMIDTGQKIKNASSQMPLYNWAIIIVLLLICIVVGFSFKQLASALCCSALGTVLIFTGMILLLCNKGSMPISIISSRSSFYITVFAAMIIFGTTEQLLLCKKPISSPAAKSQTGGKKQKSKWIKKIGA